MYSPNPNPYTPIDPSSFGLDPGPPYPVYPAADMSHGYNSKYGPAPSGFGFGGTGGHGSAYGPPGPSSGGYDYHAPHPHSYQPPHPIPFIKFSPKSGRKGKGAALSALTLLAFLYFLNLLQSCLKEHMETMNPTVMVMTAGATRRKDAGEILLSDKDSTVGEYAAVDGYGVNDEKFRPITSGWNHMPVAGSEGNEKHGYEYHKHSAGSEWFRKDGGRKDNSDYYQ
ncbi:uncharacterized protein LOC129763107 [Toxorhynchites rutilus septentrionalis]|uniref:uncharacterized protein LOC129763107 n=1 Tax=Toxorhynchites rutilus septentrionalis TaxID=329112 RepID=UPI0024794B31|nr:uncharacterized protein LOC129763107 [Toxorhynchites rutilus septentrionalis]